MIDDSNRRIDDRLDVAWRATLTTEDDDNVPCRIVDVAMAGTKVHAPGGSAIKVGDEILLSVEKLGDFAAKVAWTYGEDIGLRILAGPDLLLKKFAEPSGSAISDEPKEPDDT